MACPLLGTSVCAVLHVRVRLVKRDMTISVTALGRVERPIGLPCQQKVAVGGGGQLKVSEKPEDEAVWHRRRECSNTSGGNWPQPPVLRA